MSNPDLVGLLAPVRAIARKAGEEILKVYGTDFEVRTKADRSPVTDADEAAERLVLSELERLSPDIPIVSEEAVAAGRVPEGARKRFWAVDPLDGTKEFIRHSGEFSVNIGLIENRRAVLGVVHLPVPDLTYSAAGPGTAMCVDDGFPPRAIAARKAPGDGVVVVSSRSHGNDAALDRFLSKLPVKARLVAGGAVKFCKVASGEADLYPRFGQTSEWDTAAGHAILEAAGGSVSTLQGDEFLYGKPGFLNPEFIARGRPS